MNRVIFGDCRDTMRDLKARGVRVQCCVIQLGQMAQRLGLVEFVEVDTLKLAKRASGRVK